MGGWVWVASFLARMLIVFGCSLSDVGWRLVTRMLRDISKGWVCFIFCQIVDFVTCGWVGEASFGVEGLALVTFSTVFCNGYFLLQRLLLQRLLSLPWLAGSELFLHFFDLCIGVEVHTWLSWPKRRLKLCTVNNKFFWRTFIIST